MKKIIITFFIIFIIAGIIFYTLMSSFNNMERLIVKSIFADGEKIPIKYTCEGDNVNPPLEIENIPSNAQSLVLIVEDPDAPAGTWVHWAVFNIPITNKIEENSVPGQEGINDFKNTSYGGPCPPSGSHRYYFKVYALDTTLNLSFATKTDVERAMKGHILAKGELIGRFR